MNIFEGKNIIITGGSSGVGRVLANRLAGRGGHIALVARNIAKLEETAAEIRSAAAPHQRIMTFSCDVADADAVEQAFNQIASEWGTPHILINSAGILREGYFEHQGTDTFREVMDINFFGTLHCTRAVLPFFKESGGGRIVNIASVAGMMGVFGYAAYCASKHAVIGLTASLRAELKAQNITFHLVCPPEFDSPMVDAVNVDRTPENKMMAQTIPVMTAEAVADAVIRGIEQNRFHIIPGLTARALTALDRYFPALGRAIVDFKIKRCYRGPQK